MNDEQGQRGPGRPRVYGKSSEKVEAFRRRLEAAGYLRKEVLVQKEVWLVMQEVAKRAGVSTVDAASGLLEHGLAMYLQQRSEDLALPIQGKLMFTDDTVSKVAGEFEGSEPNISPIDFDPIQRFLKKRREIANDNENI